MIFLSKEHYALVIYKNQWMGLVQNIIASTKRIRIARHYNEKSISEVPPRVEYTLTDKGKQLEGIFIELKRFGLSL